MDIDKWAQVVSALVGGAAVFAGGMAKDWYFSRKEEEKRKQEAKQNWIKSRREAYYNFLLIFSTPYNKDSRIYLEAALNASEFGDLTLPKAITFEKESIETLKDLIRVILKLRSNIKYSKYRQAKIIPETLANDSFSSLSTYDNNALAQKLDNTLIGLTEMADDLSAMKFDELRTIAAEAFSSSIIDALQTP